jgi:ribosomal protein S27E
MRAKCPKCGVIFETPWHPTVVHIGSLKYLKCPACGKSSMMHTGIKDEVTWPRTDTTGGTEKVKSEAELLEQRIESSKYEQ